MARTLPLVTPLCGPKQQVSFGTAMVMMMSHQPATRGQVVSEEKMDWQAAVEYHQAKVRYHLKMLRKLYALDETEDSPVDTPPEAPEVPC